METNFVKVDERRSDSFSNTRKWFTRSPLYGHSANMKRYFETLTLEVLQNVLRRLLMTHSKREGHLRAAITYQIQRTGEL